MDTEKLILVTNMFTHSDIKSVVKYQLYHVLITELCARICAAAQKLFDHNHISYIGDKKRQLERSLQPGFAELDAYNLDTRVHILNYSLHNMRSVHPIIYYNNIKSDISYEFRRVEKEYYNIIIQIGWVDGMDFDGTMHNYRVGLLYARSEIAASELYDIWLPV